MQVTDIQKTRVNNNAVTGLAYIIFESVMN